MASGAVALTWTCRKIQLVVYRVVDGRALVLRIRNAQRLLHDTGADEFGHGENTVFLPLSHLVAWLVDGGWRRSAGGSRGKAERGQQFEGNPHTPMTREVTSRNAKGILPLVISNGHFRWRGFLHQHNLCLCCDLKRLESSLEA